MDLLHGVEESRVSRQVRQLAVLVRGGDIHLHGVTNTDLWVATGDDEC